MIYRFEDFELNTELYTLSHAGQTKRLRRKVFQVLRYLMEHSDRVVSKQELAEQVWPDQFIANATLESAVRLLRQELGDSGRAQRIIQTSHGYGYRFAAPVVRPEVHPSSDNPSQDAARRCAVCQHVNTPDPCAAYPYCVACGTPLESHCQQCGADNLPQANFCAFCGAGLIASSVILAPEPATNVPQARPQEQHMSPAAGPIERHASRAERRQLTVLVCSLVAASRLPERLDLENLHEILRAYQSACSDVVRRYDGFVVQSVSTTLWFYFGYPQAHEDDARRAAHSGLGIIEAIRVLNIRLAREHGVRLRVRLGIHTGPVVLDEQGDGHHANPLPLGVTPNTALQIQAVAQPDTVVVSAATARLTEGYFTGQELACQRLEGELEPIRLIRILGTTGAAGRLDTTPVDRLTRFVGREAEIALLRDRWGRAKEGVGQAVLLSGEAGIGKSRLVQVIKEDIANDGPILLECRCSPYHQQSAFYPLVDLLRRMLQWQDTDTPREKLKKLENVLTQYDLPLKETLPFFASLLALSIPDDADPPLYLTPQQQRQKTLGAILTLVLEMASRQPVFLIVEDFHWVDPSTHEFLNLLIDQVPTSSICVLLTYRPSDQLPWGHQTYLTYIVLQRLSRRQVEQMVMWLTEGTPFPTELLNRVVAQSDGVPLFVEELIKTVLETGFQRDSENPYPMTADRGIMDIPATLNDSLAARLDGLDDAKGIAQLGAVIGRQFSYPVIRAISERDESILQNQLARLVKSGLVYQHGLFPHVTFVFKHALIQEAAYQSLLKQTRKIYHRKTAQALIDHCSETVALHPELVAYHYTEADLKDKAIPCWQRAGELAIERSANIEAISHFTKGIELLQGSPMTPEGIQQELELQLALGPALRMVKGHTDPDVERVYQRAYELCRDGGESKQRLSVLMGLWRFYLNRANLETAHDLAQRCLVIAKDRKDPFLLRNAYRMLGSSSFFQGQLIAALEHFDQGLECCGNRQDRAISFKSGIDHRVACLSCSAWSIWLLGYPDRAMARSYQSLALSRELGHPYSLAYALQYTALLHQSRREPIYVQEFAEENIRLSHEQGFPQWLAGGMCMKGWALAELGYVDEGLTELQQGLDLWHTMGTSLAQTHMLLRLAEVYGRKGQIDQGLVELDKALNVAHRTAECYFEAEIFRLKGVFLYLQRKETGAGSRRTHQLSKAEACFLRAIAVANDQGAKSLELRAVTSLCRFWQEQGRRREARQLLTGICEWFTEGSDTIDMQEASALLAALC